MIGVVLAGGLSSRLGQDKVRLRVHGEDKPRMLERTVHVLGACTDEVVVSCRERRGLPFRCVEDLTPGLGPLGAMYSCLRALEGPLLVLSCDLPFMNTTVLQRLLAARDTRKVMQCMTTFQQMETGYIEALVAVYEPACLPWFEKALAAGIRQLNRVVPVDLRVHVPYTQDEAQPFFNINYPEDLAKARQVITFS